MSSDVCIPALRDGFIVPLLSELGAEVDKVLHAKICVVGNDDAEEFSVVANEGGRETCSGEVRVLTRMASTDVISFSVEALLPDLSPETGFSGFSARGVIDKGQDPAVVRVLARSNRYNVWGWSPDFRR